MDKILHNFLVKYIVAGMGKEGLLVMSGFVFRLLLG